LKAHQARGDHAALDADPEAVGLEEALDALGLAIQPGLERMIVGHSNLPLQRQRGRIKRKGQEMETSGRRV
jgi:hypothetical protein